MSTASTLSTPPPELARQAVQLSADIYLPAAELQAKYPGAVIIPGGCDRCMVVRLGSPVNPSKDIIWVVFMGTHDLKSLIADLEVQRHPYAGGEVHSGFDNGVKPMWDDVVRNIIQFYRAGDSIIWTGHSRGGSQCEDAAVRYESFLAQQAVGPYDSPTEWILPFAPARLGDAAFRNSYNAILGDRTFFFHHGADIVPWLPGWLLGNRQVGHRMWYPDGVVARWVDPPILPLGINLAWILWRQRVLGLEVLLADHHVSTYQKLLT